MIKTGSLAWKFLLFWLSALSNYNPSNYSFSAVKGNFSGGGFRILSEWGEDRMEWTVELIHI